MTAVEAGFSLPVVVWNNAALGQIRDDMVAAGIPQLGVIGRNPDFVALSRSRTPMALKGTGFTTRLRSPRRYAPP